MNRTTPPSIPAPRRLSWGDMFDERAAMLGAPAFFGPPVIFVLGPWLLLVLLLIGPFVLAMMALLALAAGAGLLAASAAVIASPYLLIDHLRAGRIAPAKSPESVQLFRTHRVGSGRLGSPQPKGF